MRRPMLAALVTVCAGAAAAGPDLECGGSSQIEIGACVSETLERVDAALETAMRIAAASALELDSVTGRSVAAPALEASQDAWLAYRDAHCAAVGAMFGGGSGTGIGINACRIGLGRDRVEALLRFAR